MKPTRLFKTSSVLLFFLLNSTLVNATELRLVADVWPPFTSEQPGQRIAVDLVQTALRNASISNNVKIVPWEEVLSGIQADKYDAIVGAWQTPDRERYLLFSRSYLQNRITLIGRKDNQLDFSELRQLKGKKVGIVADYAYGDDIANNKDIIKIPGKTVADNIKKMLNAEVDFILADTLVARAIKEHLPADVTNKLKIYTKEVATQDLYFAIRKNYPDATALLDKFNDAVELMIADGTYNKILGVTWLLADSNADGVHEYIVGSNLSLASDDPANTQTSYALYGYDPAGTEAMGDGADLKKKPILKYRVLNQEYDSWGEAKQAIDQARAQGVGPYEDTSGTFDFLIGKF